MEEEGEEEAETAECAEVRRRGTRSDFSCIMMKVDLLDINERGDMDFDALSNFEKNLYVLLLFSSLHEMEGITHFFSHHLEHLPRVLSFLDEIDAPNRRAVHDLADFLKAKAGGTWNRDALEEFFCSMCKEDDEKIGAWDRDYYSKYQDMWARAREYASRRHGLEFD